MFSQTIIIIILTALVSFGAFNNRQLYNDLILYPPAINRGQYYRFLTSGFIHADLQHLLFNMLTMYFFGRVMEDYLNMQLGNWAFLTLYLGAIVISDIPSYLKNKNNPGYASLGASGGVSAVLFAFILLSPWSTIYVFILPVPAIIFGVLYMGYSIYMSRKGTDNVNHDAHLWGAVFGIVFILINMPGQVSGFLQKILNPEF
ncbi:MAG: rhomboid family intramembrane serine protease [Chitinophagaceae bacterium]|jgi:membrane associated rhomboid family serine protease|nr:rhomboid family intramembrane serine protease [Chitinophagaceae bacterium]MCU0403463.1 rhomboid family intramembrane serine protease [Chitinophagaceae bacterium]